MLPKKYHKRYRDKKRSLTVRRTQTGLGLFTNEPIKRGEFIIEYIGTTLTGKEANKRGGKYLFETSKDRFIDGSLRSNIARYVNHSCVPNCEVEIIRGRIYIYSKK